jgi:ankyrin repeat protein
MTACQEGHLEVVQLLVALGADLNTQNNVSDKFMLIYNVYINKHSIDPALAHDNEFHSYYKFEKHIVLITGWLECPYGCMLWRTCRSRYVPRR